MSLHLGCRPSEEIIKSGFFEGGAHSYEMFIIEEACRKRKSGSS